MGDLCKSSMMFFSDQHLCFADILPPPEVNLSHSLRVHTKYDHAVEVRIQKRTQYTHTEFVFLHLEQNVFSISIYRYFLSFVVWEGSEIVCIYVVVVQFYTRDLIVDDLNSLYFFFIFIRYV